MNKEQEELERELELALANIEGDIFLRQSVLNQIKFILAKRCWLKGKMPMSASEPWDNRARKVFEMSGWRPVLPIEEDK